MREKILMFDREVGNTKLGVYCPIGQNTGCGTGIDTASAGSTVVFLERDIRLKLNPQQQLGEE
jgi:hypothetical protein